MSRVSVSVVLAASLATALLVGEGANPAASARVIDRTAVCSIDLHAGLRKLDVYTQAAVAGQKDYLGNKARANASVSSGSLAGSTGFAGVVAGAASPRIYGNSTLWIDDRRCRPAAARIPLSPRGLAGGAASPFGDEYDCFPTRRVLIRVRAVFSTPTALRLDRRSGLLTTRALVREARIAVRTQTGKPLVFTSLNASGRARLFTASSCVAD